jgi:hypothetical protein
MLTLRSPFASTTAAFHHTWGQLGHAIKVRASVSLICALALGSSVLVARADWAELDKDDDVTHLWDKQAVKAVHVSRYVWTLSDLSKAGKTVNGESYQSEMTRWRLYCMNDTFVKLSVSMFEKPLGKGREVYTADEQEWKTKEFPIRPNTYLAALKKQVCQNANS